MRLWGIRIALVTAALGCGKSEKSGPRITVHAGSGSAVAPSDAASPDIAFGAVSPTEPTKIVIGGMSSCVLLHDTSVRCWGSRYQPQPVVIEGVTGVKDLAMTDTTACALTASGTVVCWDGGSMKPTPLPGITGATRFIGNGCVAVADDNVMCWHASPFVAKDGTPQLVPELAKATTFLDGGLAVFADGTAKLVDKATQRLVDTKLGPAVEYQTHADGEVVCARYESGEVKCIGNSRACKLGMAEPILSPRPGGGETAFVTDPITLPLPPAKELALDASENLCVVTKENQLACLDVGDATGKGCGKVSSLADGVKTATGNCAVLGDGSVNCLSIETERRLMIINAVAGVLEGRLLAAGPTHACAYGRVEGLVCWGANDRGQLGRGAPDQKIHREALPAVFP